MYLYGIAVLVQFEAFNPHCYNLQGMCLVSDPDPSLFRSAGCIASPLHGRKGLETLQGLDSILGMCSPELSAIINGTL
jgi:hypothetical protein